MRFPAHSPRQPLRECSRTTLATPQHLLRRPSLTKRHPRARFRRCLRAMTANSWAQSLRSVGKKTARLVKRSGTSRECQQGWQPSLTGALLLSLAGTSNRTLLLLCCTSLRSVSSTRSHSFEQILTRFVQAPKEAGRCIPRLDLTKTSEELSL